MAGRGRPPKETLSRERDQTQREAEKVYLAPDDEVRGFDLPVGPDWPDQTRDWWDTWRKSAQASTFTDTDWSFLLDTAILHMRFWDGEASVAGELRLRVAKFGATPEDRARLKIEVGEPKGSRQVRPKSAATRTRKERVLKVVASDAG